MLIVLTLVVILGSVMYLVEQGQNGVTSIPASIYWAIVTITTVGYGDISPATPLGKAVASFIMLIGYGIIAVPTGIVTTEMARAVRQKEQSVEACRVAAAKGTTAMPSIANSAAATCNRCRNVPYGLLKKLTSLLII